MLQFDDGKPQHRQCMGEFIHMEASDGGRQHLPQMCDPEACGKVERQLYDDAEPIKKVDGCATS